MDALSENASTPQRGHRSLYINFEDDRLTGTNTKDLKGILEGYYELYPARRDEKNLYLFFDEIHEIPGWEKFIRRILDSEPYRIFITGSSAKMLSKEIASSLRGRTLVREIFPYSFVEYLRHIGENFDDKPSTKERAAIVHHMNNYLLMGGFPETVAATEPLHREILQGSIETVIYRDIVERYGVTNIQALRKTLVHCLQNPASSFSINKMYNTLKSQGYSIGKNSLYDFMRYFQDAYCLFSVPTFSLSSKKASLVPSKIYPIDPGLIKAYCIDRDFQRGSTLETAVFGALRRQGNNIYYFMTAGGQEVDFFVATSNGTKAIYQVCMSLKDPSNRKRELNALQNAMKETGLRVALVITLDEEEEISVAEGKIRSLPLWKFLRMEGS